MLLHKTVFGGYGKKFRKSEARKGEKKKIIIKHQKQNAYELPPGSLDPGPKLDLCRVIVLGFCGICLLFYGMIFSILGDGVSPK